MPHVTRRLINKLGGGGILGRVKNLGNLGSLGIIICGFYKLSDFLNFPLLSLRYVGWILNFEFPPPAPERV